MTQEEELDAFVEKWGGRIRLYELLEKLMVSPDNGNFADELSILVEHNTTARSRVAESLRVIAAGGLLGDIVTTPFQGTLETHSTSSADDFFKAKSSSYLLNAETQHVLEEIALDNEEGWPDAGKDIG